MMRVLRALASLFILPQKVPQDTAEKKRDINRRVVMTHTTGNIRIQNGRYLTEEDMRDRYDRVRQYTFD